MVMVVYVFTIPGDVSLLRNRPCDVIDLGAFKIRVERWLRGFAPKCIILRTSADSWMVFIYFYIGHEVKIVKIYMFYLKYFSMW